MQITLSQSKQIFHYHLVRRSQIMKKAHKDKKETAEYD